MKDCWIGKKKKKGPRSVPLSSGFDEGGRVEKIR